MLRDEAFAFLFEPAPAGELISLDCETTGLNPRVDEILSVAAVPVRGNTVVTSERFEALVAAEQRSSAEAVKIHGLRESDLRNGRKMEEVLPELLRFIGGRPLLGYYIDFDVRMLDKYVWRQFGTWLPNKRVEVSRLYFDRKYGDAPDSECDLRFTVIAEDLEIPLLPQHEAFNDAVMAAMMYLKLRDFQTRGVRIPRKQEQRVPAPIWA